jgi:hypothetical protein
MCASSSSSSVAEDASWIEQSLSPYESVLKKIQACLFWVNQIGMIVVLVLVNLLFGIMYKLKLSLAPTVFLLLALKVLIQLQLQEGRLLATYLPRVFPEVNGQPSTTYRIYSLQDIAAPLALIARWIGGIVRLLQPNKSASIASTIVRVFILAILYFVLKRTGSFWPTFCVINSALLLPAVLLHPAVKSQVQKVIAAIPR